MLILLQLVEEAGERIQGGGGAWGVESPQCLQVQLVISDLVSLKFFFEFLLHL